MDYLPITVEMRDRKCLIVGGGAAAATKLKQLHKSGSRVTVVSQTFDEEILKLVELHPSLSLIHSNFRSDLLKDCYLVIAADNERIINREVSLAAQRKNVWVNVVEDVELSTLLCQLLLIGRLCLLRFPVRVSQQLW